jgi:hypothetical protein
MRFLAARWTRASVAAVVLAIGPVMRGYAAPGDSASAGPLTRDPSIRWTFDTHG